MEIHKAVKKPKINSLWARVVLGILILLMNAGFVYGIYCMVTVSVPENGSGTSVVPIAQVYEALIMLFAGGLGSGLYAIRAYLEHACDRKDFDPDYLPWYPFWMVMGALLSLIFYFALRGGLLFLTINNNQTAIQSLNGWSLAAAGSLIGLFSKYALGKLRKVFLTVFGEPEDQTPVTTTPAATPTAVPTAAPGGDGNIPVAGTLEMIVPK